MAFNESGHYINVANLNLLNEHIISYGDIYTPTKPAVTLAHLQDMYQKGNGKIETVQASKNNWSVVVDQRQVAYKNVKSFTTRLVAGLSGTNVDKKLIGDAKVIAAKIQATRSVKVKTDAPSEGAEQRTISVSRQSFDSLYENFSDLANLVTSAEGYESNNHEFSIDAINTYKNSLLTANQNVDNATVRIINDRIARNEFLYALETGLVDTALAAREYIKSLFGASSAQYKAVKGISFRNIRE